MVVLSSPHNRLLQKLQLLDIYDLTSNALSRFIEDIQDRRTAARRTAVLKKVRKSKPQVVRKPAKKKTATKQVRRKRAKKTKVVALGD